MNTAAIAAASFFAAVFLSLGAGMGWAMLQRRQGIYAPRVAIAAWLSLLPAVVIVALLLPQLAGLGVVICWLAFGFGAGQYIRSRWHPQDAGVGDRGQRYRELRGIREWIADRRKPTWKADLAVQAEASLTDDQGRCLLGPAITRRGEPVGHLAGVQLGRPNFGVVGLLLGRPGSGKTTTAIRILAAGLAATPDASLLIVDPKGDRALRDAMKAAAEAAGTTWWEWSPEHPLDPLLSTTGDPHKRAIDAVERLMVTTEWSEPYYEAVTRVEWQRAARTVLAMGKPLRIENMVDVLTKAGAARAVAWFRAHPCDEGDSYGEWVDSQSDRSWNELKGIAARLNSLALSGLADHFGVADDGALTIGDLAARPGVSYLCLQSGRYPAAAKEFAQLLSVALMQDAGAVAEQGRMVRIFADELAAIPADRLDALLQRGRSSGFDVYLATQTLAGIGADTPALVAQITGTLTWLVAHASIGQGVMGEDDAERVGRLAGTRVETEITTQTHGGAFAMPTGAGSARQVDSYAVHPNVIRSLSRGQCVIVDVDKQTNDPARAQQVAVTRYVPHAAPEPRDEPAPEPEPEPVATRRSPASPYAAWAAPAAPEPEEHIVDAIVVEDEPDAEPVLEHELEPDPAPALDPEDAPSSADDAPDENEPGATADEPPAASGGTLFRN